MWIPETIGSDMDISLLSVHSFSPSYMDIRLEFTPTPSHPSSQVAGMIGFAAVISILMCAVVMDCARSVADCHLLEDHQFISF